MSGKYHYTPEKMDTKYLMLYGVVVDGVFILQFLLAAFCVSIHRRWFSSADAAAREPFDEQIYALRMIQVFCGKKKNGIHNISRRKWPYRRGVLRCAVYCALCALYAFVRVTHTNVTLFPTELPAMVSQMSNYSH